LFPCWVVNSCPYRKCDFEYWRMEKLSLWPVSITLLLPPQGNDRNFRRTVLKHPGFEPCAHLKQDSYRLLYTLVFVKWVLNLSKTSHVSAEGKRDAIKELPDVSSTSRLIFLFCHYHSVCSERNPDLPYQTNSPLGKHFHCFRRHFYKKLTFPKKKPTWKYHLLLPRVKWLSVFSSSPHTAHPPFLNFVFLRDSFAWLITRFQKEPIVWSPLYQ
jgi:hypothetical protein